MATQEEKKISAVKKDGLETKNKNIQGQALTIKDSDLKALEEAIELRKKSNLKSSRALLLDLIKNNADWLEPKKELLSSFIATGEITTLEKFLIAEHSKNNKSTWALFHLANVQSSLGKKDAEIKTLQKFAELKFDKFIFTKLFNYLRESKDLLGALKVIKKIREHEDSIELELAQLRLLQLMGKSDEVKSKCAQLLELKPPPSGAIELWTVIHLTDKSDPSLIIDKLKPLLDENKDSGDIFYALGRAYTRMDNIHEAIRHLKQATETAKPKAIWWYDLAILQRQQGNLEACQLSFQKSLAIDGLNTSAIRVRGVDRKYEYGDEAFKILNFAQANVDNFLGQARVELYYALGKAFEDVNELDTAFKYFEKGGKLYNKLVPYNHTHSVKLFQAMKRNISRATYENFAHPANQSDKPVFILGMPRSGTSLIEQVISSHPDAIGAGELKLLHRVVDGINAHKFPIRTSNKNQKMSTFIPGVDLSDCTKLTFEERGDLYVKAIESIANTLGSPNAKKIIDKMPGNYYWVGLIPFILPKAKIIHTERHPLDNCLSLFRIFFPDGMSWSYDLKNLAKVYRQCSESMAYWRETLPEGTLITVNYEVMVADFERQAKKIIAHIGLDWNDQCLRFYESDRSVKTASLIQVRKPVYNTSVGRWKKYEDHLKPLITELGPLIEAYESKVDALLKNSH